MVTKVKHPPHPIKIEFSDKTGFDSLVLSEPLCSRRSLWQNANAALPEREGCDWILKALLIGLLTGSRGTFAAQELCDSVTPLLLLSPNGALEEARVWRSLEDLGLEDLVAAKVPPDLHSAWVKAAPSQVRLRDLMVHCFFVIYGAGTLLEASSKREATKWIPEKGRRFLWCTVFAGPFLAAQRLAVQGDGEETRVRGMLGPLVDDVMVPLHERSAYFVRFAARR